MIIDDYSITGPHLEGEYIIRDYSGFAMVSVWPTDSGLPNDDLAEFILKFLREMPKEAGR